MGRLHIALRGSERGSSIVEYVLLVGLLAVACLVALNMLGSSASDGYSAVASMVSEA